MGRIRIDELKALYRAKHGEKPTNDKIAEAVFDGEKAQPHNGKRPKLITKTNRGEKIISRVNNGHEQKTMFGDRILNLADFFGVYDVRELIERSPEK